MKIVDVPLFDVVEALPAPLPATAHVANFPTFLGQPYPVQHADLGYLVPVDPADATNCEGCQ